MSHRPGTARDGDITLTAAETPQCLDRESSGVTPRLAAPVSAANAVRVMGTQLGTAAPRRGARFQGRGKGRTKHRDRELLLPAHQLPFGLPNSLLLQRTPCSSPGDGNMPALDPDTGTLAVSQRLSAWRHTVCLGTLRSTRPYYPMGLLVRN